MVKSGTQRSQECRARKKAAKEEAERKAELERQQKAEERRRTNTLQKRQARARKKQQASMSSTPNRNLFDTATPPPRPVDTPAVPGSNHYAMVEAALQSGCKPNGEPFSLEELQMLERSNASMNERDHTYTQNLDSAYHRHTGELKSAYHRHTDELKSAHDHHTGELKSVHDHHTGKLKSVHESGTKRDVAFQSLIVHNGGTR